MAEYLTKDMKLGISAIPEASYNALVPGFTDPTGANTNNYLGMLTTGRGFPLPDKDKHDDTGKVGYGREFPREQRSGYIIPPTMEITDELNVDIGAVLLRRAMGGADPTPSGGDILESGNVFQHSWVMQDNTSLAGRQLPASSVVYALGGADYLYGGCCVESFRIEQTASNVPQFTAALVGSGLFRRIRELNPTATGGTRQVETATAAGTVSADGNASVTLTAAGMAGSPIVLAVPVLTGDTPTIVAGKIRAALLANSVIYNFFYVTGSGANIILTAVIPAANDATMNLAIATGTATGITAAATSTNTTAGVAGATTYADRPNVPAPTKQNYMHGAETYMKWTTDLGTYIITDVQRLRSFNMTLTNNNRADDRRPGDPRIDATSTKKGWYVNRMNHGDRGIGAEISLMLDDNLQELVNANDDVEVTNFTYRSRGHYVTNAGATATSTTNQNTFEVSFPKCYFRAVRSNDDNGDALVQIGVFVVEDPAAIFGLMRARIVNNRATAIV